MEEDFKEPYSCIKTGGDISCQKKAARGSGNCSVTPHSQVKAPTPGVMMFGDETLGKLLNLQ